MCQFFHYLNWDSVAVAAQSFCFPSLNVILIAWIQACILELLDNSEMGWSDLPFDLLGLITEKVISFSFSDYIRFSCICVQWQYFFLENYEHIKLFNLPVLLIPAFIDHNYNSYPPLNPAIENPIAMYNYYDPKETWLGLDYKQRHKDTRHFYSISEKKVYDFQLPIPSNLNCRGSSHGWLVVVEECIDDFYPVHLLNPFKPDNNKIQLPSLNTVAQTHVPVLDSYSLKKAIVSRSPSLANDDNELIVLALYGTCAMGFCRPGDERWTPLPKGRHGHTFDFIVYQGQFWGILQDGGAVTFDLVNEPTVTLVVEPHKDDQPHSTGRYLVESAGDLFQVRRDLYMSKVDFSYGTEGFEVFKLDPTVMEWVKTNTLDGRMFFLGDNASTSISPSNIPGGMCKPNSLYYTDDLHEGYNSDPWEGPHDMGIFNVEDETFEPHYRMGPNMIIPTPIWIQPML